VPLGDRVTVWAESWKAATSNPSVKIVLKEKFCFMLKVLKFNV